MFPATSQVKLLIAQLNIILGGGGEGGGAGVVRGGRGGKVLCCMACAGVCWLLGREWFLPSNS